MNALAFSNTRLGLKDQVLPARLETMISRLQYTTEPNRDPATLQKEQIQSMNAGEHPKVNNPALNALILKLYPFEV